MTLPAGSGQSTLPHQTRSASTGQPEQIQHSGPAQSSRANPRQPQAHPQPEQRNGPAQSSRAVGQQPQAPARSQARSSPLYAESEGEDSETESSNGGSEAAREAEQPQQQQPVVEPRHARASDQASRAASKPPTGRGKGGAGPSAPLRKKKAQDLPKGRRQVAPTDDEEDVEGFGLFSQDQQEPVRQSKQSRVKPNGKVQV